jgi:hypothetical protein
MGTALSPVAAPPSFVEPGPTRNLLTALHEYGWSVLLPAHDGKATVVSPDGSRSMVIALDLLAEDLDKLETFIDGQWLPTAWAVTYVREGR